MLQCEVSEPGSGRGSVYTCLYNWEDSNVIEVINCITVEEGKIGLRVGGRKRARLVGSDWSAQRQTGSIYSFQSTTTQLQPEMPLASSTCSR